MRFDLPHEPDIPRPRGVEPEANKPVRMPLPASVIAENLALLQRPAVDVPNHRNAPIESKHAPERERAGRNRTPDHRPSRKREGIALEIRDVRLRPEERRLLAETGRFRVLQIKDIAQSIYNGDDRALRSDLNYLRRCGLVSLNSVAPRNDGGWLTKPRIEVVTLTKQGESLAHLTGGFTSEQKLYHGLVKPREVEHDSHIYRAYLKEAERIEKLGGSNLRVQLDFELKPKVQKAIHVAQKADPSRSIDEIKREVAEQHGLPFVGNKIEIPDVRIRYDLDQGTRTAFCDVEVVTPTYRPANMKAKSQTGFRTYASVSDRSRLAKVENEQHTLDWVMDL
jgi:hypothetical protein